MLKQPEKRPQLGRLAPETEQQRRDAATIGPADIVAAQSWAQGIRQPGSTTTPKGHKVFVKAVMVRELFKPQ